MRVCARRPWPSAPISVCAVVQAHPAREHLWSDLLASLEPLYSYVSVHSSEPPNPWEGYKLALAYFLDQREHSHCVLLQEDTIVCRNFPPAVEKIAEAHPTIPIALFLAWQPRPVAVASLRATLAGQPYIRMPVSKFCPVVAIMWPREAATRFLEWAFSAPLPGRPNPASDDAIVGEWIRRKQETVFVTCPSLVQHPDTVESVKGRQNAVWGADKGRIAANYIGEKDPLEIDWTLPPAA